MAWTQTDIDTLEAEIAQARKSIADGDKSISFESLTDRLKLLDRMRREIKPASKRPHVHFASFSRGDR